jgi:hypothetical protein
VEDSPFRDRVEHRLVLGDVHADAREPRVGQGAKIRDAYVASSNREKSRSSENRYVSK